MKVRVFILCLSTSLLESELKIILSAHLPTKEQGFQRAFTYRELTTTVISNISSSSSGVSSGVFHTVLREKP